MPTVSISRVVLGEMSNSLIGDLCHVTRIVVRVVPESLNWNQAQKVVLVCGVLSLESIT